MDRQIFARWFAILSLCCLCQAVQAKDWYVDNVAGDDLWNGARSRGTYDREGPFHSIGRALQYVSPGDRIVLVKNDKPYHECISLVGTRHSGSVLTPLIIEGNGAILDGAAEVPEEAWKYEGNQIYRLPLAQSSYQQLFLDGKPALRVVGNKANDFPYLAWRLEAGSLLFKTEPTKIPLHYKPTIAQHPVGITVYRPQRVIIRDLTVQGFQIDGIQVHDAGMRHPILLSGVTARGNGRSGIAVVGASGVGIDACLIGNNGVVQVLVSAPAETVVTNSTILDNTAPKFEVQGQADLTIDGQLWQKEPTNKSK